MLADWEAMIEELKALSMQMLELAQAEEWEGVMSREAQRRGLIETLFVNPVPPVVAPQLTAAIRFVLASDAAILALGQRELGVLAEQLGTLAQGRKVQLAYGASIGRF